MKIFSFLINKATELNLNKKFILFSTVILTLIFILQLFYYIRITNTANKMLDGYIDSMVRQSVSIIANMMNEARQVAYHFSYGSIIEDFLAPRSEYDLYVMWSYQEDFVRTAVESSLHIYDIAFYRTDGHIRYQYNHSNMNNRAILDKYADEIMRPGIKAGFVCFSSEDTEKTTLRIPAFIQPIWHTSTPSKYGKLIGFCVVMLNPDLVNRMINDISTVGNTDFYLVDSGGITVSSTREPPPFMENFMRRKSVIVREIEQSGWYLVCSVNGDSTINNYRFFGSFFLVTAALIFLLLSILLHLFNQNIVSPISKLHQEINNVIYSRFTGRINMSYNSEIGGIALAINIMLEHHAKIAEQILMTQQNLYKKELEAKQNELTAMENQVNPHFLMNTLQCICGIAVAYNTPLIAHITSGLAGILAYSLRGKDEVTLADEVKCLRQYLSIIDIRFDHAFCWKIDIPEYLLDQRIAKMILQPLAENAIYHGLEKRGTGSLSISAKTVDKFVYIIIEDDGVGIEKNELARLQNMLSDRNIIQKESIEHKRIGIANTCRRIKLMFGDDYGLKLASISGRGTRVELVIPLYKTD
jgi:sensor histidine kinase YesM